MLLSLAPEEQDSELPLDLSSKDLKLPASPNCSPRGLIPSPPKVESTPPSATCMKTIGDGTHTIQLKEATGLEIRMLFIICVNRPPKLSFNWNHTDYRFQEPNKEKFIKEHSVDNQGTKEKVGNILDFRTSLSNLCSR
jgi:hypothetical protein